jgi:hypothetical protein
MHQMQNVTLTCVFDVQTIEKDLRMMKPQIDAIVTKCEALKTESASEQYNRLLNDNGIYTQLDHSTECSNVVLAVKKSRISPCTSLFCRKPSAAWLADLTFSSKSSFFWWQMADEVYRR